MRGQAILCAGFVFWGFTLLEPTAARGDDAEQEALVAKRDEKLKSDFLKNGEWITDYDAALKEAERSQRLVFGYFTRSYSP